MKPQQHNRWLPLSQKHQDAIFKEEVRARERIIREQLLLKAKTTKKGNQGK